MIRMPSHDTTNVMRGHPADLCVDVHVMRHETDSFAPIKSHVFSRSGFFRRRATPFFVSHIVYREPIAVVAFSPVHSIDSMIALCFTRDVVTFIYISIGQDRVSYISIW